MKIGERLKYLRLENGLTQQQLAKKVRCSKSNISKYESGAIEPNIGMIKTFSGLYKVSESYLLGNSDIRDPDAEISALKMGTGKVGMALDNIGAGSISGALSFGSDIVQSEAVNITGGVSGSGNTILGSNRGSLVVRDGEEYHLSAEAAELLKLYDELTLKKRVKLLQTAIDLSESDD